MGERVLICGSRGWTDQAAIRGAIVDLPKGSIVIHGCADGADEIAGRLAQGWGFHTAEVHPLWGLHGRSAGFKRNCAMLDLLPDRVVAFWDGKSPGTKGTIDEAVRRGIPVEIFESVSATSKEGTD